MLDLPERPVIPPTRSKHYSNDLDAPGPLDRSIKTLPDSLPEPVHTKEDKIKKAREVGARLTLIEKQIYGTDTGYGRDTEEHELDHALADDKKGREGQFKLVHHKGDLIPGYQTIGKRTPKERMKIASAPKEMSEQDKQIFNRAKLELKQQRLKTILITSVAATPFICGGLIYLASH